MRSKKPTAKRKRKLVLARIKHKKPTKAAAVPVPFPIVPELAPIPSQPLFVAPKHYFTGGGLVMPADYLPDFFVLASDPRPADHRVAEFRSYRTEPGGKYTRCVRYELKPEIVDSIRAQAARIRKEIEADDCSALSRREHRLLLAKSRRTGAPVFAMRRVCK
jgi:hypothetical protein